MNRIIKKGPARLTAIVLAAMLLFTGCGKDAVPEGTESSESSEVTENNENTAAEDKQGLSDERSVENKESADVVQGDTDNVFKGIVITHHKLECDIDGTNYSKGSYSDIELPQEAKEKYPKLSEQIDILNSAWVDDAASITGQQAPWAMEQDPNGEWTNWYYMEASLLRADDKMFSFANSTDDYSGGAHPYGTVTIWNYDPVTGRDIPLKSVLDNDRDFTEHVYEELMEAYPEEGFGENDTFNVPEMLEAMYYGEPDEEANFTYYIDDKGLNIHFGTYAIASYAAGTFDIVMTYEEYPDLVKDRYKPDSWTAPSDIATYKEDENVIKVEPQYDGDAYEGDTAFIMSNPSWEYYCSENAVAAGTLIQLEQISDTKYEWLDDEKWVRDNGYEGTSLPYTDGDYYYEAYNPAEYDYMYQCLRIYDGADDMGTVAYDFDLSVLCNGPDEAALKNSNTTQYIRYAKIADRVLYVSMIHNGYSSNEPESNYVAAISLDTYEVLWKSAPLVCNSSNFVIAEDALICGYGFTDEPDFIYVLDLGDGSIANKIKVRTAPEVFAHVGNELRVATYNTEYVYNISFG